MDVLNAKKVKGLCCFLFLLTVNFSSASRLAMGSQNVEVKKYLSRLNKTPLKSITSPDGDIIDCIRMFDQPAFDHPSLKNHTNIQMRPFYRPEKEIDELPINQLWHLSGSCPEGTISIRRTKEDDVLRAGSVERFGKKLRRGVYHKYAIARVKRGEYYGGKAIMNVWNPHIDHPNLKYREFSLAQLWVYSTLDSIEAGWHVNPRLYGDTRTRLFTFWTIDDYKYTGCYNLLCTGFIQISNKIALGASLSPISTYRGSQHDISILIWKDPKGHNWWLQFGNTILGFWPENMFSELLGSASYIDWGGEVTVNTLHKRHPTPQMGSGHFPREGFGKASYFKNIKIVDGSYKLRNPHRLSTLVDKCYGISLGKSRLWENYFYFGGPGCP